MVSIEACVHDLPIFQSNSEDNILSYLTYIKYLMIKHSEDICLGQVSVRPNLRLVSVLFPISFRIVSVMMLI